MRNKVHDPICSIFLVERRTTRTMDFGVSTVFKIIGKGISIAKAIWKIVQDVKALQEQRRQLQRQVNVLISILDSIRTVDTLKDPKVASELQKSLGNLDLILEDVAEACARFNFEKALAALKTFSGKEQRFLKRLFKKIKQAKELGMIVLSAEGKAKALAVLDQRLKLALSIVQIGFSCTQVRQIKHLGVRLTSGFRELTYTTDDTLDIYTDPYNGDGVPKPVTDVKAEVNNQRLIVSWNSDGDGGEAKSTKYEVRYNELKHSIVTCAKSPVALGSHRIKPWEDYAVQVRAVNDAGASSWSFPPVYVRMDEGAPSCPSFIVFETVSKTSLNVVTDKPSDVQAVTHVIVEKLKVCSEQARWDFEESKIDSDFGHMLNGLDPTSEYMIRVRFRNRFDVSEPSAPVSIKIEDMLPNAVTDLELFKSVGGKLEIRFKLPTLNTGAIDKYTITLKKKDASGSKTVFFEVDGSREADRQTGVVSLPLDIAIDESSKYKITVNAVAKKGTMKTVGYLTFPVIEKSLDDIPEVIGPEPFMIVEDPKVSAIFAESDEYY